MKHLTTLLTMAITLTGLAQQMPYNPDANGDDFVGVDDVLGVLGVYDTALMQPDLQCDYEGTEFESFIVGLITEELILDSVYVEYLIRDTLTYFTPGCPDEIIEPIILERSYTMFNSQGEVNQSWGAEVEVSTNYFSYHRRFSIAYYESVNEFFLQIYDNEVGQLPNFPPNAQWDDPMIPGSNSSLLLPLPEEWSLDEDGVQIDWWISDWPTMCEHFRLIPFWHEAE